MTVCVNQLTVKTGKGYIGSFTFVRLMLPHLEVSYMIPMMPPVLLAAL